MSCQNCGQRLVGRFCSQCGQDSKQNKRALASFGYDFVESTLGYDSKLWRTLIPFWIRPGYLTNEYNAGRRVRYLHPRKMYFFISIVFFLLFTVFDQARFLDLSRDRNDLLKTATEMATTAGGVTTNIESGIESATGQRVPLKVRIAQKLDSLKRMDRTLLKERFSRNIASNTPKMLFLLLPVFALILLALFRRPERFYVEHVVFAFHAHTYLFAIASVCLIYELVSGDTRGASYGLLAIPPYVLLSMRAVYKNPWPMTLLKFVGALVLYAACLAAALVVLVAITFWFL